MAARKCRVTQIHIHGLNCVFTGQSNAAHTLLLWHGSLLGMRTVLVGREEAHCWGCGRSSSEGRSRTGRLQTRGAQLRQLSGSGQATSPLCASVSLLRNVKGLARTGGGELPPHSRLYAGQGTFVPSSCHSRMGTITLVVLWLWYVTIAQRRLGLRLQEKWS